MRQKSADAQLLAFIAERVADSKGQSITVLDLACGTGSQLIANQPHLATAILVGLDLSGGMVSQAKRKASGIEWVQADSRRPPFADESFDYVSNQFAFHHVQEKADLFQAAYRLLKPSGRLAVINIVPHEMANWLYYRYFPAAFEADLQDYLPLEALIDLVIEAGFNRVMVDLDHFSMEEDLAQFAATARQRHYSSQLLIIADADYQAGLSRLEADLRQAGGQPLPVKNEICLMTLIADKA
jgi:SAM-dependent methyltransferase